MRFTLLTVVAAFTSIALVPNAVAMPLAQQKLAAPRSVGTGLASPLAVLDTSRPSVPQGYTMKGATKNTITLGWNASTDNVRVAGYRIYRDGALAGRTARTSYKLTGLVCGRQYTLALEAYDHAGNVSDRAAATTVRSTIACRVADTAPPTVPQGYTMTGAT
jgi:hypothetical protein